MLQLIRKGETTCSPLLSLLSATAFLFLTFILTAAIRVFLTGLTQRLVCWLAEVLFGGGFCTTHAGITIKASTVGIGFTNAVAFFAFAEIAVLVLLTKVTRPVTFCYAIIFTQAVFATPVIGTVIIILTNTFSAVTFTLAFLRVAITVFVTGGANLAGAYDDGGTSR